MLSVEQLQKMFGLNDDRSKPEYNYTPDIMTIKIDGKSIDCYASYSYFDAKSYVKSPERSANGTIDNLDSYATFLTPRLKIKFSMMPLETYRTIMKLIQQKNEFIIECYDIVWDKVKAWKGYFSTEDYPELFIYDLYTLGVIGYEIELQGTNADMDLVSIIYHKNDGSGLTYSPDQIYRGQEVIIGYGADDLKERVGYHFEGWVTNPDKTNENDYNDLQSYVINNVNQSTNALVLYARWSSTNTRTLSYNYGVGETYINTSDNSPLYSKTIAEKQAIGALPTTNAKQVIVDGKEYYPYTYKGWYWTPEITTSSTPITSSTIYNVKGNATIYQIFEANKYTITFNSDGGNYTPSYPNGIAYGSVLAQPNTPTKDGYTFVGWYITKINNETQNGETKFAFGTMPPYNISLKAKWKAK